LEVQRSSRYRSMIIIIIAAAWSKLSFTDTCSYYILWSRITCSCLYDVDEDLQNLGMCDFSYDAQCSHSLSLEGVTMSSTSRGQCKTQDTSLEDSTSSSNSLYSVFFINDHYIELTKFEIQEIVNILVSGEAY
ncbi:hypothetical protein Tco_1339823, partial [Tanacetum coccineum]